MTAPNPKLETATAPQDSEPIASDIVEVHNLTLEAALKIVRELINREEPIAERRYAKTGT
jgi:hypothetical protein